MTTYGRPRPLPLTPTQVPSAFGMRQVLTHQNPLSRETLLELLDSVQLKLFARRGKQTTLVVHGGVISVLGTQHRYVTTDVDYIERVLPEEVEKRMKGEMLARNRSSSSLTSIAKRMGRALSAGEAREYGVVDYVAGEGQSAAEKAVEVAQMIAANGEFANVFGGRRRC